jgi:hypothetical protein
MANPTDMVVKENEKLSIFWIIPKFIASIIN